jgi:hypothetical protein
MQPHSHIVQWRCMALPVGVMASSLLFDLGLFLLTCMCGKPVADAVNQSLGLSPPARHVC